MAASAGSMILRGLRTGKTYNIDVYIPDAASTLLTFNPSGLSGTGSPTTYRTAEDCLIVDIATATAPTAVGGVFNINGNPVGGGAFRWATQLSTNPNRNLLAIPVRGGDFIGATQF